MRNSRIAYTEYELKDGEIIAMSTAPILLYKLRKSNKKAYEKMSRIMVKGLDENDVMELYEFLYAAYVNANQDEDNQIPFEDFLEKVNEDFVYNANICKEMISKPKKQNSEQPS